MHELTLSWIGNFEEKIDPSHIYLGNPILITILDDLMPQTYATICHDILWDASKYL